MIHLDSTEEGQMAEIRKNMKDHFFFKNDVYGGKERGSL